MIELALSVFIGWILPFAAGICIYSFIKYLIRRIYEKIRH